MYNLINSLDLIVLIFFFKVTYFVQHPRKIIILQLFSLKYVFVALFLIHFLCYWSVYVISIFLSRTFSNQYILLIPNTFFWSIFHRNCCSNSFYRLFSITSLKSTHAILVIHLFLYFLKLYLDPKRSLCDQVTRLVSRKWRGVLTIQFTWHWKL